MTSRAEWPEQTEMRCEPATLNASLFLARCADAVIVPCQGDFVTAQHAPGYGYRVVCFERECRIRLGCIPDLPVIQGKPVQPSRKDGNLPHLRRQIFRQSGLGLGMESSVIAKFALSICPNCIGWRRRLRFGRARRRLPHTHGGVVARQPRSIVVQSRTCLRGLQILPMRTPEHEYQRHAKCWKIISHIDLAAPDPSGRICATTPMSQMPSGAPIAYARVNFAVRNEYETDNRNSPAGRLRSWRDNAPSQPLQASEHRRRAWHFRSIRRSSARKRGAPDRRRIR